MLSMLEARCIKCFTIFCCAECRWIHEKKVHRLKFDCPICRGFSYHCDIRKLTIEFKQHLIKEHNPLKCKRCKTVFESMDKLESVAQCTSLSELIDSEAIEKSQVDDKFDSLYDKINNNEAETAPAIKTNRTAVVTPMVNKKKLLVDYPFTDSEDEKETPKNLFNLGTPYPTILVPKTPKLKKLRSATPHVKKFIKQKAVEFCDDACAEEDETNTEITPSRKEGETERQNFTTPTSHLYHAVKLVEAVTTSTPTHSAVGTWSLFAEPGADSPLSEIENTNGSTNVSEASKTESDMAPKLKSIMSGSRLKVGSQDSSERQDSVNNTEGSAKAKKVTFAEDTVFQLEPKKGRVFRKPKRMLTPGPQKPKYCFNPRFQALINRFENNGMTMSRTPTITSRKNPTEEENTTPPVEKQSNIHARAINFKDDSPVIESQDNTKETTELFRTCVDSPENSGFNNAIAALTTNVAGSLHNCLDSVLKTTNEETEIEFKFVITKKKVTVKRIADDVPGIDMDPAGFERDKNKENIWTTVAKVVKSVFWSEQGTNSAETPFRTYSSNDTTSSSASKRKFDDLSDAESPVNHKKKKFEGRIKARPSIHRHRDQGVTPLRTTVSAGHADIKKEVDNDDWNQSF